MVTNKATKIISAGAVVPGADWVSCWGISLPCVSDLYRLAMWLILNNRNDKTSNYHGSYPGKHVEGPQYEAGSR